MQDPESVARLHATLRPHLLRRVIKDVEKVQGCVWGARGTGRRAPLSWLRVGGGSGREPVSACCASLLSAPPLHRSPLPAPYPPALPQSLPPKNERILRVGMTPLQAQYYQWILKKNFKELNKVRPPQAACLCVYVRVCMIFMGSGAGRRCRAV